MEFDNPRIAPNDVIRKRIRTLYPDITVSFVERYTEPDNQIAHLVITDIATDATAINQAIFTPPTTSELDEFSVNQSALRNLKDDYLSAVNALQNQIDEQNWTNAKVINAVTIHARILLYMLRILKYLLVH